MFWSYFLVDVNISYSYISHGTGHRKYGKIDVWWVYVSNTVYHHGDKASEFSIQWSPKQKQFFKEAIHSSLESFQGYLTSLMLYGQAKVPGWECNYKRQQSLTATCVLDHSYHRNPQRSILNALVYINKYRDSISFWNGYTNYGRTYFRLVKTLCTVFLHTRDRCVQVYPKVLLTPGDYFVTTTASTVEDTNSFLCTLASSFSTWWGLGAYLTLLLLYERDHRLIATPRRACLLFPHLDITTTPGLQPKQEPATNASSKQVSWYQIKKSQD